MNQLIMVLGIILAGFIIGYCIQLVVRLKDTEKADDKLVKFRKYLQIGAILVLHPIAVFNTIWAFELSNIKIFFMPFMGLLTMLAGGSAGLILGRLMRLSRPEKGALFITSTISNTASVGGLIVFSLLGESGFALVPIYRLLEEVGCYTVAFPMAKSFSPEIQQVESLSRRFAKIFLDPFILVTITSILVGIGLNLSGLPRPSFFTLVNTIVIPISTLFLLISIGLSMRFTIVKKYLWKGLSVSGIKFIWIPMIVVLTSYALGLSEIDGGLPLKVIAILSSMPVAFFSLVPVSVYKLDLDLANSVWLISTAVLIVFIPILIMIVNIL